MILSQEHIAQAMHYDPSQTSKIEKCLRGQGITYFYGRAGCIWTTTELISQAAKQTIAANDPIKIDKPNAKTKKKQN